MADRRRPLFTTSLVCAALLGAPLAAQPVSEVGGCPVLPPDNVWNAPVDRLPVHPLSDDYVDTMGRSGQLHPDFGSGLWQGAPIGIPYNVVPLGQALVPVEFDEPGESDPGAPGQGAGYPIPAAPLIEGGPSSAGDRHVLVVRQGDCVLFETYSSYPDGAGGCVEPGGWCAYSGAVFPLGSNQLRPDTWTSADAAGLPILPGLARYDEVALADGEIRHALRFTATPTQGAYVWPARHEASDSTDPADPPMGLRLRLKSSVDLSGFSPQVRRVLRALQRYGMILADNGSDWYVTGAPDPGWTEDLVDELHQIVGDDFEAVDVSSLPTDPDSGATTHLFSDDFERGSTRSWILTIP